MRSNSQFYSMMLDCIEQTGSYIAILDCIMQFYITLNDIVL